MDLWSCSFFWGSAETKPMHYGCSYFTFQDAFEIPDIFNGARHELTRMSKQREYCVLYGIENLSIDPCESY